MSYDIGESNARINDFMRNTPDNYGGSPAKYCSECEQEMCRCCDRCPACDGCDATEAA
jgi:hypothetical protein